MNKKTAYTITFRPHDEPRNGWEFTFLFLPTPEQLQDVIYKTAALLQAANKSEDAKCVEELAGIAKVMQPIQLTEGGWTEDVYVCGTHVGAIYVTETEAWEETIEQPSRS